MMTISKEVFVLRDELSDASRLGRSTAEVIALINELIARNIRVIILKQNLDIHKHDMNSKIVITLFSMFAELQRDLISLRTKEALAPCRAQPVFATAPNHLLARQATSSDSDSPAFDVREMSHDHFKTDRKVNTWRTPTL